MPSSLPPISLIFFHHHHLILKPHTTLFFKRVPNYKALRVFGCACFPCLRPYNQSKLQPRSEECLFLGYSGNHKGYKCLSKQGKIYISKDVIFNETHFPFLSLFSPKSPNTSSNCIHVPFINTNPLSYHLPILLYLLLPPHP